MSGPGIFPLAVRMVYQVAQAVKETAVWYQAWLEGKDMEAFTDEQIRKYFTLQER